MLLNLNKMFCSNLVYKVNQSIYDKSQMQISKLAIYRSKMAKSKAKHIWGICRQQGSWLRIIHTKSRTPNMEDQQSQQMSHHFIAHTSAARPDVASSCFFNVLLNSWNSWSKQERLHPSDCAYCCLVTNGHGGRKRDQRPHI
jgi:hypothetical protein